MVGKVKTADIKEVVDLLKPQAKNCKFKGL